MSASVIQRVVIGGLTSAANLSDDVLRSLATISDDFADDMMRALAQGDDAFREFLEANADDITRALGDDAGETTIQALRTLPPAVLSAARNLNSALDDIIRGAAESGEDFATYYARNRAALNARYGGSVTNVLDDTADDITAALARDAAAAAPAAVTTGGRWSLGSYLNTAPTRGQTLLWGVAPAATLYTIAQIDDLTDGELGYAALNAFADGTVAAYRAATEDMTPEEAREWLANRLNEAESLVSMVSTEAVENFGLNAFVDAAAATSDPAEADQNAINAAVAFQFRNPVFLVAKLAVRGRIIQEVHSDLSQDERDRMLAEGLIDDLVEGTDCAALRARDIEVTHENVEEILRENPALLANVPDNIRNGLMQMFPDLADEIEALPEPPEMPTIDGTVSPPMGADTMQTLARISQLSAEERERLSGDDLTTAFQAVTAAVDGGQLNIGRDINLPFGMGSFNLTQTFFSIASGLAGLASLVDEFCGTNLSDRLERMAVSMAAGQIETQLGGRPEFTEALRNLPGAETVPEVVPGGAAPVALTS